MLAIRLKRTGRKAYAVYRVAVQEAQRHPSSGKVVAYVGTYNPHTKEATFDKELVEKYLNNGAQPTPRIVKLLKDAKIKLPSWVKEPNLSKARATRNPEKLRKNAPKEEVAPEAPAEEAPAEEVATEATEAEATPAE
ncbi:30S ribosomal protein S16 [Candidatus Saccharibacteria bacterium]|nr:MAG: 30S ribosomal protein S16 [Candidatus Saccharibacteria bacterium]